MPLLPHAKKALRASFKKALVNRRVKSRARTMIATVRAKVAPENANRAFSAIDRAVKKNLFHKNKAARLKSQVSRLLKAA